MQVKSDIYSCGAVLFEMLTGLDYQRDNKYELSKKKISCGLINLVERMLD